MTDYSGSLAAVAAAKAAPVTPEHKAAVEAALVDGPAQVRAIRAKHATDYPSRFTYTVTRAPSGPYADLKVCDWCGDQAATWLITSNGWTEQACMRHAGEFFPDLFDQDGRQLKYRVCLVTNGGIGSEWIKMSERGFIQWRADIQKLYGSKAVHRHVWLADGRMAFSWTWESERPFGAGRWVDTLRVVQL